MKKITLLLSSMFISYAISSYATEELTETTNQFYDETISDIVRGRYLPIAETSKQDFVISSIKNSDYMIEFKEKTFDCLSKIPGLIEGKVDETNPIAVMRMQSQLRKCFSPVMGTLMERVSIATAEAETGNKINETNPIEKMNAISMGSKIISDNAATMHYANSLSGSIAMLSTIAISANGGTGQDITASEVKELKNIKIACGAELFGKKDGSVLVNFQEKCERIEKSDEKFDISVDNVIKGIQKENGRRHTFTCEGYRCIWKRK